MIGMRANGSCIIWTQLSRSFIPVRFSTRFAQRVTARVGRMALLRVSNTRFHRGRSTLTKPYNNRWINHCDEDVEYALYSRLKISFKTTFSTFLHIINNEKDAVYVSGCGLIVCSALLSGNEFNLMRAYLTSKRDWFAKKGEKSLLSNLHNILSSVSAGHSGTLTSSHDPNRPYVHRNQTELASEKNSALQLDSFEQPWFIVD